MPSFLSGFVIYLGLRMHQFQKYHLLKSNLIFLSLLWAEMTQIVTGVGARQFQWCLGFA